MAAGYNKTILIGNLTQDPELRYTAGGTPVASFSIAVNTTYGNGDQKKENTLFMPVTIFGKQAESCSKYLGKGSGALVEGRLEEQRWEHDGKQHKKIALIAQTVRFLDKKSESSGHERETRASEETDLEPF